MIDARGKRNTRHTKQGTLASQSNAQGASLFEETTFSRQNRTNKSSKSSRPVARELEVEKEKEVLRGYQRVKELTPAMKTGNEVAIKEWLLEAEKLIETFRETRRLFLSTRVGNLFCLSKSPPLRRISPLDFKGCSKLNATSKRMRTVWHHGYRLKWVSSRAQTRFYPPIGVSDREKGTSSKRSQNLVDVFRSVSFDDWLQVTMEVITPL